MKTIKTFIVVVLTSILGVTAFAQNQTKKPAVKTETVKVLGNCGMCEARIEKAAKIKGVSKAEWNVNTKVLTIVYNPAVVKSEDIQKSVAAAGHDTEKFKADDKTYNSLPGCCKYERKK